MRNNQAYTDKLSIGLSMLCMLHCFALPIILVSLPSALALTLESEAFHLWMLLAVLPTSIYALTIGCKKHKSYNLAVLGFTGLAFLFSGAILGEFTGEMGEKILTAIGATLLSIAHFKNYKLCQAHDCSDCGKPHHNQKIHHSSE